MTVIATRTLTVTSDGKEVPVPVRLFAPEPLNPKWHCRYEIDWPEGRVTSHAQGFDAVDALHLALQKIGTELYMSSHHHRRAMWWVKPWVGYGFPLPQSARSELIGTDAEYYG